MSGNHWSDWIVEPGTPITHPCVSAEKIDGGFTDDDAMDRDELLRRIHEELDLRTIDQQAAIEGSVA